MTSQIAWQIASPCVLPEASPLLLQSKQPLPGGGGKVKFARTDSKGSQRGLPEMRSRPSIQSITRLRSKRPPVTRGSRSTSAKTCECESSEMLPSFSGRSTCSAW